MKKIAFTLLLLCALALHGQHIDNGSMWYNGALVYDATLLEGGKVILSDTEEGEEIAFMLVPVKGKPDTYSITQAPIDAMMVEDEGATVQYIQQSSASITRMAACTK